MNFIFLYLKSFQRCARNIDMIDAMVSFRSVKMHMDGAYVTLG